MTDADEMLPGPACRPQICNAKLIFFHYALLSSCLKIGGGVTIILADLEPPMKTSWLADAELTLDHLQTWMIDAGYTSEKLNEMARCLPKKK